MAKPPADADPDKFIIGSGTYSSLLTARVVCNGGAAIIQPAPVPVAMIAVVDLIFIAFFIGFSWVLKHFSHGEAGPLVIYVVPIAIGFMTCIGFTVLVYYSFSREQRLGVWLIFDRATEAVTLPRENICFQRNEIVHLQYITTKRLGWGRVTNNQRLSELNLITCRNGQHQRWPLLRSIYNVKAFDYLLRPIAENTNLPIVRVTDEWLGWKTTEKPYDETSFKLENRS